MSPACALNTYLGPALVIILVFVQCARKYSSSVKQKYLFCGLLTAAFVLMTADFIFFLLPNPAKAVWSFIAALFLFFYFNSVRKETKIDSLTGMENRYGFNDFIHKLSKHKTKEEYTIAVINIDRFREINDNFGHLEGDNALRDVAAIIGGCMRPSDFAARYRGDDFILAVSADDNIQRIIDKVEEELEIQNSLHDRPYQLYVSYGYDIFTTNSGRSIRDFVNHIENLMYKYKEIKSCSKN